MSPIPRRSILKTLGSVAAGSIANSTLGHSANDVIQVGCIGTGGRAQFLMKALAQLPNARIAAVCDVWDTALAKGAALAVPGAFSTKDYRAILDRKDIDAVLIGTPNHQHVPLLVAACEAGKDVYIEKPLTHSLEEGRAALAAQNTHNRIVQVGMQQRSMPQFQTGYQIVKSGQLGEIRKVHLTWNRNAPRGAGKYDIDPSTVDWKAWLGPARDQPFDPYRFREWRWYWDFGGGTFADLMVHFIDIAHWYLDVDHPVQAVSIGSHFTPQSQWETPDTAQTLLQYPGAQVYFESTFMNARNGAMLEFMGTEGTLYLDRGRMEVIPERRSDSRNRNAAIPTVPAMELVIGTGPRGADFYEQPDGESLHLAGWLESIRTRKKPRTPVEAGISAAAAAQLANIALRENKVARWEVEGPKS